MAGHDSHKAFVYYTQWTYVPCQSLEAKSRRVVNKNNAVLRNSATSYYTATYSYLYVWFSNVSCIQFNPTY